MKLKYPEKKQRYQRIGVLRFIKVWRNPILVDLHRSN